ncbi:MAG: hypothetical protein M5U28_04090 [Sandaracinaceae bacterium]|nr:hypothetical protein [Sandaracinaceae bacterium]
MGARERLRLPQEPADHARALREARLQRLERDALALALVERVVDAAHAADRHEARVMR